MPFCSEMWPTWSMASGISHADDLANLGDILLEQVEALVGEVQAGERVGDVMHIVGGVAAAPLFQRLDRAAAGVDAVPFERAGRGDDRARDIRDLHQAQIHLEEGEAERPCAP